MDLSFGRKDLNEFFLRLQEQDDTVASWSDATVTRLKQVLQKLLVENEYLDEKGSDHLNPMIIYSVLEDAIRADDMEIVLPAFNCLY